MKAAGSLGRTSLRTDLYTSFPGPSLRTLPHAAAASPVNRERRQEVEESGAAPVGREVGRGKLAAELAETRANPHFPGRGPPRRRRQTNSYAAARRGERGPAGRSALAIHPDIHQRAEMAAETAHARGSKRGGRSRVSVGLT